MHNPRSHQRLRRRKKHCFPPRHRSAKRTHHLRPSASIRGSISFIICRTNPTLPLRPRRLCGSSVSFSDLRNEPPIRNPKSEIRNRPNEPTPSAFIRVHLRFHPRRRELPNEPTTPRHAPCKLIDRKSTRLNSSHSQ